MTSSSLSGLSQTSTHWSASPGSKATTSEFSPSLTNVVGGGDRNQGAALPQGSMPEVQDSYKHLGIPQTNESHEGCKEASHSSVFTQSKAGPEKNKVRALHMYALPVIRYPAGIIS